MVLRSPVCTIVGHVDHGKTKILDQIRGTAIVASEAGGITQAIGASIIPLDTIKRICGPLLSAQRQFTIPGLLFIDTPGHEAFSTLRKRGGNLADIAILVVDIKEGFKPQTIEAVEILKNYKTPFIVAANKIDLLNCWKSSDKSLIASIHAQSPEAVTAMETGIYNIVGKLAELGLESERFDRVDDYTKQIAIIPTCAKTGEGIPELLMVLTGLAQKYLEQCLTCNVDQCAKGTVLEVKEEKGLGSTIDVIIYDGTLNVGDSIIIGGVDKPVITKVKALFEPAPLAEMRDKKAKFKSVKQAFAATGVKIGAPDLKEVIAGMPIRSFHPNDIHKVSEEIQKEVSEVIIETDKEGVIIKADALGGLEALTKLLRDKKIQIRKARIGNISKNDVSDAESSYEKDSFSAVILGFNVSVPPDVEVILKEKPVKVITNNVIYKIIEDFVAWQEQEKKAIEERELNSLVRPCKMQIMSGYVFRQSNPAVVGVEVLIGKIKSGTDVMTSQGRTVAKLKSMQLEKESITEAVKGKQVAMALDGATVGRQINENDFLYSVIPEEHFRLMKKLKSYLSRDEIEILKEIAVMMRVNNPVWGI